MLPEEDDLALPVAEPAPDLSPEGGGALDLGPNDVAEATRLVLPSERDEIEALFEQLLDD